MTPTESTEPAGRSEEEALEQVIAKGLSQRQGVHADDVARAVLAAGYRKVVDE